MVSTAAASRLSKRFLYLGTAIMSVVLGAWFWIGT
jgi:hypothetical protein